MGLLAEIRTFVGKFINNPIKTMVAAYLIYKILNSGKKESINMIENIKILYKDKDFEIIQDTDTKNVAVIDGRGVHNDSYPAKDLFDAKKIIQKIKGEKNSCGGERKMKELFEVRFKDGGTKKFGRYKDAQIYAGNQKKRNPTIVDLSKESFPRLNALHEKVCKEKFLGRDEVIYTTNGKPITKTGSIKLNREEFGEVEHELFGGGNIKVATNAKRPSGGICNDRVCPVHSDGKYPARFLINKNGVDVTVGNKVFRGDSYKCSKGGEVYIELEKDAKPYKESFPRLNALHEKVCKEATLSKRKFEHPNGKTVEYTLQKDGMEKKDADKYALDLEQHDSKKDTKVIKSGSKYAVYSHKESFPRLNALHEKVCKEGYDRDSNEAPCKKCRQDTPLLTLKKNKGLCDDCV